MAAYEEDQEPRLIRTIDDILTGEVDTNHGLKYLEHDFKHATPHDRTRALDHLTHFPPSLIHAGVGPDDLSDIRAILADGGSNTNVSVSVLSLNLLKSWLVTPMDLVGDAAGGSFFDLDLNFGILEKFGKDILALLLIMFGPGEADFAQRVCRVLLFLFIDYYVRRVRAPEGRLVLAVLLLSALIDYVLLNALTNLHQDPLGMRLRVLPSSPAELSALYAHEAKMDRTQLHIPLPGEGDPEMAKQLHKVSSRVIAAAKRNLPGIDQLVNLTAHYSAADNYNAYSLPTGDMIFYEPLVKALSDEELAFVVGHEIAHAVLFHHSERNFHKMFVSDTLDDILCTVTGQMCSGKGRDVGPGFFRDASMSAAGMALQSKLNQKTEFEADLYGIYFAGLANYEPAKALGFFEIDKATGAKPERKEFATKRSNWLATNIKNGLIGTHPLDADRVAALKKDAFADSASLAALRHVASGPNGNKVVTVNGGSLGLLQLISDKQGTTTEDDTLEYLVMAHIALVGVAIAVASRSLCQLWDNVVGHYTTLRTSHRLTRQDRTVFKAYQVVLAGVLPPNWTRLRASLDMGVAFLALLLTFACQALLFYAFCLAPFWDKLEEIPEMIFNPEKQGKDMDSPAEWVGRLAFLLLNFLWASYPWFCSVFGSLWDILQELGVVGPASRHPAYWALRWVLPAEQADEKARRARRDPGIWPSVKREHHDPVTVNARRASDKREAAQVLREALGEEVEEEEQEEWREKLAQRVVAAASPPAKAARRRASGGKGAKRASGAAAARSPSPPPAGRKGAAAARSSRRTTMG